ncbi:hypothetical protein M2132_000189 [Dysgonomonas sp. PH5-45]|uniref:hypothetical protein n=1 Tax=unclassified Dysgonomonas TaxID=2630389 RepID=UPI002473E35D|nr:MULTISPECIES: hypothetical protein [unclassified Dysgonomonas]MDH6353872.1 hypothetical protein [Dysgonomonas sp. PH5-45]MDH6386775.1 hypothetical protein [Dysgonomonas sp. PH5-37]
MKRIILTIALSLGLVSYAGITEAQNVSISINIGSQPAWGPVGYDYVDYYYLPDIDVYYGVNTGLFYYWHGRRWVSARYLPYSYHHYDLFRMYKVVLNTRDPWIHNHRHRHDYRRYKGNRSQVIIRNSRDNRYHNSRNNNVPWVRESDRRNNNRVGNGRNTYSIHDRQQSGNRKEGLQARPNAGTSTRDKNISNNRTQSGIKNNNSRTTNNSRSANNKQSPSKGNNKRGNSTR